MKCITQLLRSYVFLFTIKLNADYIIEAELYCRWRALYKGLVPKVMRLGPGGAIMLIVYDHVHHLLQQRFPDWRLSFQISCPLWQTIYKQCCIFESHPRFYNKENKTSSKAFIIVYIDEVFLLSCLWLVL